MIHKVLSGEMIMLITKHEKFHSYQTGSMTSSNEARLDHGMMQLLLVQSSWRSVGASCLEVDGDFVQHRYFLENSPPVKKNV